MAGTVVTPLKSVASLNNLPEAVITELRQWWVNGGPNGGPSWRAQEILTSWGFQISHTKLMRWCEHAWPELQCEDEDCLEDPNASHEENTRRLLARKTLIVARQINIDNKYAPDALSATAEALRKITIAALQIEKAEAERARTEEYKKQLRAELWDEVHQQMTVQLQAEIHEPPDLFELMDHKSIAAYLSAKIQKPPEQESLQSSAGEQLQ